jgi:outer membrane usher protein FimD/PapC
VERAVNTDRHPLTYQAAHLEEALAVDSRVGEQALHVHVDGDVLIVEGCAATPERRDAVAVVSAECVPGVEVRNKVTVVRVDPPIGER